MGFYYETLLCSGTFVNEKKATIDKKFKIPTIDPVVEKHEWTRGYVSKKELGEYLNKNFKNIKVVDSEGNDLFFAESVASTLELGPATYKYIIIEKDCSYEISN